ncbi:hypothetical protein JM32_003000 [Salmonella enterica]|uniref:Uncharacterized protein n=2 Tax=Salmonella enterica TaxID=28901 RepID=A0A735Y542_SALER|nr:hypothetical protein [Salmonella enterica subsp. enterica serovar Kentucky]EDQ8700546.1 hypothetical protein [Salmonella enterica subsp. enterica serovar Johannesburg]EDR3987043.1 hypothetical protein [Salmonella enterica]EDR5359205.1 hypothetical protein [Salmonella enterica subsp. enterica]EDU3538104.1 hypothetical protein [Salmonella enterica subsp. enterica serovar Mbandaka]EDV1576443.1 hypothetical protein [Salmonella enterica subsp. enterica serovar 4,[5],12:i:-]EDZ7747398.1 hypothet
MADDPSGFSSPSKFPPPALCRRVGNLELRWAILIIFLIGLLVVTGVFKMIF